ncbi:MAG TPA: hypothetical protein VH880_12195 [Anaeromyxobacteraceae bacterium]|jgi:hypothetical protein
MSNLRLVLPLAVLLTLAASGCGSTSKTISDCSLPGSTKCGTPPVCVNLQEDQLNCGACGAACAVGKACLAGACTATCAPPLTKCGTGAAAVCADTASDAAHCGTCGNSCAVGLDCDRGTCRWTAHRFTSCGATGAVGPTQAACDTAYAGTGLAGKVVVTAGIQEWVAPAAGNYRIEAFGAQGHSATDNFLGGQGARVGGDFALTAGQVLQILVGQPGSRVSAAQCNGGGGGGTFVVDKATASALVVAGGGAGTRVAASQNGCAGRVTDLGGLGSGTAAGGLPSTPTFFACGPRPAGSAGTGGASSGGGSWGSGGGGMTGNGADDSPYGKGGLAFANGGAGGAGGGCGATSEGPGGFGGGGAGDGCCGGGGGGGYSGGEGGYIAGGGGSFNGGTNPVNTPGANPGAGFATIDPL